ncbi:MAG: homoserine kinase [Anaerosomatales bacterium]|nr:homoserine kinase [Anaerosomatales bacterium]MDT8434734.1 homoserine kinase [Anaerosomatales bacterium]
MPRVHTVTIPATSANLGPGFDSFGLALALHNRFSAELAEEWHVEVAGEGEGLLSSGADNRVARSVARVFAEAGRPGLAASLRCENNIPPGAGLGSSAAAIVGGLILGDALCGSDLDRETLLALATEIEGHPDNVAAALYGGFTVSWALSDGTPRCMRLEPARGLAAVVVSAHAQLATPDARELLPATVPHADAAFSAGRAGLLVAGIALGDAGALAAGLADRIHEPYRAAAVGDLEAVRSALLAAGATGAALSGAGPTVIGLVAEADDASALAHAVEIAARARPAIERLEGRCEPLAVGISRSGATLA